MAGRNSRDSQKPIPSTLEPRYAELLPSKTPHLFMTLSLEFKGPPAIQTFLKKLSAPCWGPGSTDMKLSKHQNLKTHLKGLLSPYHPSSSLTQSPVIAITGYLQRKSHHEAPLPNLFKASHCPGNQSLASACKAHMSWTTLHRGLLSLPLSSLALMLWPSSSSTPALLPPQDLGPQRLPSVWLPGFIVLCMSPIKGHFLREVSQDFPR